MPQSGFEDGFTISTSGSLDTWVKEIFAKVPGAVEGYIYDQVKLTINDFFRRSLTWRDTAGPFNILADDGTYCLNPFTGYSNVIQVLNLYRNGIGYTPVPITKIRESWGSGSTNPRSYFVTPFDTIVLTPTNTADVEALYADVALAPRILSDNRIEEWVVDQCYEAVKAGTLARLYEEPGKVYTNTTAAELWGKRYRSEVARSRSAGMANYKSGTTSWTFPRWGM